MSVRSARAFRDVVVVVFTLALTFVAPAAKGEGRLRFLVEHLQYPPAAGASDDFRLRVNAALGLGGVNSDEAVAPLCKALDDPSEAVRQAVAIALRRLLRPASLACLERRIGVETKTSVLSEMRRAFDALSPARRASAPPTDVARSKVYVAVSKVVNHTSRPSAEVDALVRKAIVSELSSRDGYELVPAEEAGDPRKTAPRDPRSHGYFLAVSVDKFDDSGEALRVGVTLTVLSFPGKDLKGEVPAHASLPGARVGERASEDRLMTLVAAHAADMFAQNFR